MQARPPLPPGVRQVYLPLQQARADGAEIVYHPCLLGAAQVAYHSARHKVAASRDIVVSLEVSDGPVPVDWSAPEPLHLAPSELMDEGIVNARYAPVPRPARDPDNYSKWEKAFKTWLRTENPLILRKSPAYKLVSRVEETEGEFRARLQLHAREQRDQQIRKLRAKYDDKIQQVEKHVLKAQQKLDEQASQALQSKIDTALSVGTAILGAVMGRKRTPAGGAGGALRKVGRMRKESADAALAEGELEGARAELQALNDELESELQRLSENMDIQSEHLEQILIRPRASDINIRYFGAAWTPRIRPGRGPGGP